MPGYGISAEAEGLLEWDWVDERMVASRNYWIGSTRPDGRPHVAPVWGVWLEGTLYFSTGRTSGKGRNLSANPEVNAHLESGDEVVIIEGVVYEVTDEALLSRVFKTYAAKYPPFDPAENPDPDAVWYGVKARKVFAWLEVDFPNTATRWQFDGA